MTFVASRYHNFQAFSCSHDGDALCRRILGITRHHLTEPLTKIDPNWHSVDFRFKEEKRNLLEHPLTDEDACVVEFDYRPSQVTLVGPNVGNMLITDQIFDMMPEPLFALMRMLDSFEFWIHKINNPKHVIELIDGKTIIYFENCTGGVVRNVINDDEFDVESLAGEIELDPTDQMHFTRASLLAGFEVDGLCGQPVCVDYFPLSPREGIPVNNADDVREAHRIAEERYETERPQREAEEAARQKAKEESETKAYAALSPEEKAKVDARKTRLGKRFEIVKILSKLAPQP